MRKDPPKAAARRKRRRVRQAFMRQDSHLRPEGIKQNPASAFSPPYRRTREVRRVLPVSRFGQAAADLRPILFSRRWAFFAVAGRGFRSALRTNSRTGWGFRRRSKNSPRAVTAWPIAIFRHSGLA